MSVLFPEEIAVDPVSGAVSPSTGHHVRRLGDLGGLFLDEPARAAEQSALGDPIVYDVIEYKKDGADLFFGTTIIQSGKVGDEYYMTRGHYHARADLGEVYCTQRGHGILLLETRDGLSETVRMVPGSCAFIPPGWAHRSINVGDEPLVFTWFCSVEAGHDYAAIAERGMLKRVVERDGAPRVVDNDLRR